VLFLLLINTKKEIENQGVVKREMTRVVSSTTEKSCFSSEALILFLNFPGNSLLTLQNPYFSNLILNYVAL
jgi:hypothetical protein